MTKRHAFKTKGSHGMQRLNGAQEGRRQTFNDDDKRWWWRGRVWRAGRVAKSKSGQLISCRTHTKVASHQLKNTFDKVKKFFFDGVPLCNKLPFCAFF